MERCAQNVAEDQEGQPLTFLQKKKIIITFLGDFKKEIKLNTFHLNDLLSDHMQRVRAEGLLQKLFRSHSCTAPLAVWHLCTGCTPSPLYIR